MHAREVNTNSNNIDWTMQASDETQSTGEDKYHPEIRSPFFSGALSNKGIY